MSDERTTSVGGTWGALMDGEKVYPVHPGQQRALNSRARFTAFIAGTGSGKTALGPLWLARWVEKTVRRKETFKGLVVAPTHPILDRETVPMLVETWRGTDLEGRHVASRNKYVLPGGLGIVYTVSADRWEGLEGGQFDAVWVDEGGQLRYEAWVAIQGRTGLNQAPVLITTTPYRLNWLKKEVVDRWRSGDTDYEVVGCSSIANPAYPVAEYERARQTLPLPLFRMRYDGEFTGVEGRVYPEFSFDENVRPCNYDPTLPIQVGMDFNVNPMAWVLCHRKGEVLEVFDELWLRDCTTRHALNVLWDRYGASQPPSGGFFFFGDASSRQRRTSASTSDYVQIMEDARFKRVGREIHIGQSNPLRINRFAATNARLCSASGERRLFIDPRVTNLIRDIESRYYKDGTREPDDSKAGGHSCDALDYVVYPQWRLRVHTGGDGAVIIGSRIRRAY